LLFLVCWSKCEILPFFFIFVYLGPAIGKGLTFSGVRDALLVPELS
jgi:hypothetical protein